MTHAPKFWANKLKPHYLPVFWNLVTEWGFSGETAYHRALAGAKAFRRA